MTTNTTEYYQLSQFPKIEDRNTILNETTDDNKKIDKALRNHHNRIVVIEEDKLKIHSSINSITEKLNTDEQQIEANKRAITDINNMSDGTTILNKKISDIDEKVKTLEGTTVDTTNFATKDELNTVKTSISDINNMSDETTTLNEKISDIDGSVGILSSRVGTIEGTLSSNSFVTRSEIIYVRNDIANNTEQINTVKEQVNTNTQGIAQNKSDIDELKKKISTEATTTTITNIQGMPTEISIGNMQTLSFSVSITATTTDTETLATGEFKLTFDKSNNMFTIYASPSATLGAHQVPYLVGTETKYITVTVKEYKNYIVGFTPYNNGMSKSVSCGGNSKNLIAIGTPLYSTGYGYYPEHLTSYSVDSTIGIGVERATREGDYIDAEEPIMLNSILQLRSGTLGFSGIFGDYQAGVNDTDGGWGRPSWIETRYLNAAEVSTNHKAGYYAIGYIGGGHGVKAENSTSYNYIITASNSTGTKTASTVMTLEGIGNGD